MRFKKIFTAGVAILSAIMLLSGCAQISKNTDPSTNVKPSEGFVFNDIETITALPGLTAVPDELNGWTSVESFDGSGINLRSYVNDVGCTFSIMSQQSPSEDIGQGDFYLSKQNAYLAAETEEGTLTNESMIKVKSNAGDLDFVSGEYNPKVIWNTTAGADQPFTTLEEPWTTFLAVRTIDSPITLPEGDATGPSELDNNPETGNDDSQYAEGEITSMLETIPSVVIKYSCETANYDAADVKNMISQISLDLSTEK